MIHEEIPTCLDCYSDSFSITVVRTDTLILDGYGNIEDKEGSDQILDLKCHHCGATIRESKYLTDDQREAIFWEIEQHLFDT